MRGAETSLPYQTLAAVSRFLCRLLVMLSLPVAAAAQNPANPNGLNNAAGDVWQGGPPRWTVSVEGILLDRIGGGASRTLVERVPGSVPFFATAAATGPEAFNSSQFQQGFSGGPKVSLIYRGDSGYGGELAYFNVFDQGDSRAIGPDSPADWLVMKAPGTFWQTQDFPNQAMVWSSTTNLYSAEANGRFDLSPRLTLLAGFRWLQLNDNLQGTLTPPDLSAPGWKRSCFVCNIFQITPDGPAGNYPPFWNAGTTNNLYGIQVGAEATILELDRLSLDGQFKVGLFDNNVAQATGVSLQKVVHPASASTNGAAFASEAGLSLKYQLIDGLKLKAGYELLWLDGVALAPGQIEATASTPSTVQALGVRHASSVLFQGLTFGVEYSF